MGDGGECADGAKMGWGGATLYDVTMTFTLCCCVAGFELEVGKWNKNKKENSKNLFTISGERFRLKHEACVHLEQCRLLFMAATLT